MTRKHFPIGFWNYPAVGAYGIEEVDRWVKCGITWNQSPRFSYDTNKPEELIELMDKCAEQGIKMTVCIKGLTYKDALNDPEAYRILFDRAYRDFGKHPATEGFFIGDEPVGDEQMRGCVEAYRAMLSAAPESQPFINFNPFYQGFEEAALKGQPFKEWVRDFCESSGCRRICYDCYNQMNEGEEGTEFYFLNLNKYTEIAQDVGIEVWTTLLSSAHFLYRAPSEDDLRWQLSTAVASGCTGILWFFFYDKLCNNNYRSSPIDPFGEETDTYRNLQRVQRIFHAMYGDLLVNLKWKRTWHFQKAYGGYPLFGEDDHPLIMHVNSEQGLPGILSRFEDAQGKEYICIVNNSPFKPGCFTFTLSKKTQKILRIRENGAQEVDFIANHHDAVYRENAFDILAGCYLAPGQMELFRFE